MGQKYKDPTGKSRRIFSHALQQYSNNVGSLLRVKFRWNYRTLR